MVLNVKSYSNTFNQKCIWQFSYCKHVMSSFNQNAILPLQNTILFMCIWHNILLSFGMVFTKFDRLARCILTPIVKFQIFDFISYLSFHKGFARLKHWKHIKFSLEEINCNESKVSIYECCELNISIHRFCLHGTTIVRIY